MSYKQGHSFISCFTIILNNSRHLSLFSMTRILSVNRLKKPSLEILHTIKLSHHQLPLPMLCLLLVMFPVQKWHGLASLCRAISLHYLQRKGNGQRHFCQCYSSGLEISLMSGLFLRATSSMHCKKSPGLYTQHLLATWTTSVQACPSSAW